MRDQRNINIWLDAYDDIFSDFDSRTYADRALSDDFTRQVAKVCGESSLPVSELSLMLPDKERMKDVESVIARRLHAYFRTNYREGRAIKRRTLFRGGAMLMAGLAVMICASYLNIHRGQATGAGILLIIMEPAGWFLVWTGLDELYYGLRKRKPDLAFYTKMSHCKISFVGTKTK